MTLFTFDESGIRQAYSRRDVAGKQELYTWLRYDALYMAYRKRVAWSLVLMEANFHNLSELEILDVGCGIGGWLRMLTEWGADPRRLHGIDLLEDRIEKAKAESFPPIDFRLGNACELDYADNAMDLCAASTVFSSILDPAARLSLALEMTRVVRPKGCVMIFDFSVSDPRNPDTIGIRKKEILRLFPGLELQRTFKLIFPPPLLRKFPRRLLGLAQLLEDIIPIICTHRLYLLRK